MTDLSQHIPGATMAAVARIVTSERFAVRGTNLFISNVPGAQLPLYLAGAQLVQQHGMAPLANNMGLFVATPSYNGRIAFSIISERAVMPDIAFFRACIEESFADLMAAVPKPEKPKTATAKPKTAAKPKPAPENGTKPVVKPKRKPVAKGNATRKTPKK
jgi:cell division septation protein DedD